MALSEPWIPKHYSNVPPLSDDISWTGLLLDVGFVSAEKSPHQKCTTAEFNLLWVCGVDEPFFTEQHCGYISVSQGDDNSMHSNHSNCHLSKNIFNKSKADTGEYDNLCLGFFIIKS